MPINATNQATNPNKTMLITVKKPRGTKYVAENLPDILDRMFPANGTDSIRKTIFNEHNITRSDISTMLQAGTLTLPAKTYAQIDELRDELFADVFLGNSTFTYKVQDNGPPLNPDEAAKNRVDMALRVLRTDIGSDYIDGVMGNGFWPIEVFGDTVGKNIILGIIDRTINPWRESFQGIHVTRTICLDTGCYPNDVLDDDPETHGTTVTETALKFLPGIRHIDAYHHLSYSTGDDALLSLEQVFVQIEKKLIALGATGKRFAYILNMSQRLQQHFDWWSLSKAKYTNFDETNTAFRVFRMVNRLHKMYPRFQMFSSRGNNYTLPSHLLVQAPEVMAIGGHDINFNHFSDSSYGEHVRTSVLASDVQGILEEIRSSGTSFAAPTLNAIDGILMDLIPDLKNYESREIIAELSVPVDQFFVHLDERARLHTPVFIFDLVKFCEILNKKYRHRIDPKILTLLNERAKTYYIDSVPRNGNVRNVIPNYDGNIPFNLNDKIAFGLTVNNPLNTTGEVYFSLSSARIPPRGVDNLLFDFRRKYVRKDTFISAPAFLPIPAHFYGNVSVEIKRETGAEIEYWYKLNNDSWQESSIDYRGRGLVRNIMLGLATDKNIQIQGLESLRFLESTTNSPTPPPTEGNYADFWNESEPFDGTFDGLQKYFDDQIEAKIARDKTENGIMIGDDYMSDDYTLETPPNHAGAWMSGVGLCMLFGLYHLRKKMQRTPATDTPSKQRTMRFSA